MGLAAGSKQTTYRSRKPLRSWAVTAHIPSLFDPEAIRHVRIPGSYPLGDTDRALEAIAGSAGLRVERPSSDEVRLVR